MIRPFLDFDEQLFIEKKYHAVKTNQDTNWEGSL